MSVNQVVLVGRLTKPVELSYTPDQQAVAKFTLATSTSYKDKKTDKWIENSEFHNCLLWGKRAETLANYSQKGSTLSVEGSLQTRKYEQNGETKYFTEIKVSKCDIYSDKKNKDVPMHQNEATPLPKSNLSQEDINAEIDAW